MFLLVPAYPGCPGSKAVKRSLLFSHSSECNIWCSCYKVNVQPKGGLISHLTLENFDTVKIAKLAIKEDIFLRINKVNRSLCP